MIDKSSGSVVHSKVSALHEMVGDNPCDNKIYGEGTAEQGLKDFEYMSELLEKVWTMGTFEGSLTKEEMLECNRLNKKYKKMKKRLDTYT